MRNLMNDPLATYLNDHLGGSSFAIELLESLRDGHIGQPLGVLAEKLLAEVLDDRKVLLQIAERVGTGSPDLKQAAGWIVEKVSRIKLQSDSDGGLGVFESLETLALGILGKASLWRALSVLRQFDPRVATQDYDRLAQRAQSQHDRVEAHRLRLVPETFTPAP